MSLSTSTMVANLLLEGLTSNQRPTMDALLAHFPDAFYPTQTHGDTPWVHAWLTARRHQVDADQIGWLTAHFGPDFLSCPDAHGATLADRLLGQLENELARRVLDIQTKSQMANSHNHALRSEPLLAVLEATSPQALARREDGGLAPGTALLHRVLALHGEHAGRSSIGLGKADRLASVLIEKGAELLRPFQGTALLHALVTDSQAQTALAMLSPGLPGTDPLDPSRPVEAVLADRFPTLAPAPPHQDRAYWDRLHQSKSKADARAALMSRTDWLNLADARGRPAIWAAVQAAPAWLGDLAKQGPDTPLRALAAPDAWGRPAWYHAGRLDGHHHFSSDHATFLQTLLPPPTLTPQGEGLVAQTWREDLSAKDYSSDLSALPKALAWLGEFHRSADLTQRLWGTPTAQAHLAGRLLAFLARDMGRMTPVTRSRLSLSNGWEELLNTITHDSVRPTLSHLTPALQGSLWVALVGSGLKPSDKRKHATLPFLIQPTWAPVVPAVVMAAVEQWMTQQVPRLLAGSVPPDALRAQLREGLLQLRPAALERPTPRRPRA